VLHEFCGLKMTFSTIPCSSSRVESKSSLILFTSGPLAGDGGVTLRHGREIQFSRFYSVQLLAYPFSCIPQVWRGVLCHPIDQSHHRNGASMLKWMIPDFSDTCSVRTLLHVPSFSHQLYKHPFLLCKQQLRMYVCT
jgi:hypothetical protein